MHDFARSKMIIWFWHNLLKMEKYDLGWHQADIIDELAEYKRAEGFMERWSELSDIVYTYTRARWSGHTNISFPLSRGLFIWGSLYMFPKYTLRWLFFAFAGKLLKSKRLIREVRNPKKISKLDEIADKYGLEKNAFRSTCRKLLRFCPLLK
jgi:hypothetical protein